MTAMLKVAGQAAPQAPQEEAEGLPETRKALVRLADELGFLDVVEGPPVAYVDTPGARWVYDTLAIGGIKLEGQLDTGSPAPTIRHAVAALMNSFESWAQEQGTYGKVLVIRAWPQVRRTENDFRVRMRCVAVPKREWQAWLEKPIGDCEDGETRAPQPGEVANCSSTNHGPTFSTGCAQNEPQAPRYSDQRIAVSEDAVAIGDQWMDPGAVVEAAIAWLEVAERMEWPMLDILGNEVVMPRIAR